MSGAQVLMCSSAGRCPPYTHTPLPTPRGVRWHQCPVTSNGERAWQPCPAHLIDLHNVCDDVIGVERQLAVLRYRVWRQWMGWRVRSALGYGWAGVIDMDRGLETTSYGIKRDNRA